MYRPPDPVCRDKRIHLARSVLFGRPLRWDIASGRSRNVEANCSSPAFDFCCAVIRVANCRERIVARALRKILGNLSVLSGASRTCNRRDWRHAGIPLKDSGVPNRPLACLRSCRRRHRHRYSRPTYYSLNAGLRRAPFSPFLAGLRPATQSPLNRTSAPPGASRGATLTGLGTIALSSAPALLTGRSRRHPPPPRGGGSPTRPPLSAPSRQRSARRLP
jgi:hypothetical protein